MILEWRLQLLVGRLVRGEATLLLLLLLLGVVAFRVMILLMQLVTTADVQVLRDLW